MKSIEERIEDALSEGDFLAFARASGSERALRAKQRLIAQNDKRLADLEAVRDGKAVEIVGVALVQPDGDWGIVGQPGLDDHVIAATIAKGGDRTTVGRFIAHLPDVVVDEVEAESEGA